MHPRSRSTSRSNRDGLQQSELLVSAEDGHRLRHRRLRISVPADSTSSRAASRARRPRRRQGRRPPGQRARKTFLFDAAQPLRYLALSSAGSESTTRDLLIGAESDPVGAKPVKLTVQANPRQAARVARASPNAPRPCSVLRVADRRRALPELHAGRHRERSAGRPQPAVFRAAQSAAAAVAVRVAQRSGALRRLSDVLPRARARAPVVGTGDRLEELPRAVDQRGLRAVLRRAVRGDRIAATSVFARHAAADAPLGDRAVGARTGLSRLPARPHQGDGRVFRAIVYNKGAMVLHMLRRLVGDEAFFAGVRQFYATWRFQQGRHRRLPRGDGEGERHGSRRRSSSGWIYGASDPGSRSVNGQRQRGAVRFEHRGAVMPTPVTVTITYADGTSEEVVVAVTRARGRATIELKGSGPLDRGQPRLQRGRRDRAVGFDASAFGAVLPACLGQVNRRDARFAVALERLEHQDEARTAVLVETGQAFAERAAIDFLPAALGGTAETGGHRPPQSRRCGSPCRRGTAGREPTQRAGEPTGASGRRAAGRPALRP